MSGPVEVAEGRRTEVGGLPVVRSLPRRERRTIGPWCFVDHFGPADVADASMLVGPHPHVGLHTVTLGPAPPAGGFNPLAAFSSDPLPLPAYTGSNHGDGFLNSGLLDGDTRTSLPGTTTIRFTSPGTYTIASPLHPGMIATVNVSG